MTAEGHKAADCLNGLPNAAARTSEPDGRARHTGEVAGGIQLIALLITARSAKAPPSSGTLREPIRTKIRTISGPAPPESHTICCFRWSDWAQLPYHQQTKNLLVSYPPKKPGFRSPGGMGEASGGCGAPGARPRVLRLGRSLLPFADVRLFTRHRPGRRLGQPGTR